MSDTPSQREASEQVEVIAFLAEAQRYGEMGEVTRIDTHISHVFLIGDQAFKLKRAIKLRYVDFSTPEKRHEACLTELRLNRRTAPEIYQDVRSINRSFDGTIGFKEGKPIDWLVVMRRFDQDSLLEAVAERGELTAPLVDQLADIIASFHGSLEPLSTYDGSSKIAEVIHENRQCMLDHAPEIFSKSESEKLLHQSKELLSSIAPLLDRRAKQGHVRRCHGDLHLANICLWKDVPTLFDCLEFNEDLATIDVLYDLAFLLMDLWQKGLHVQANELFNRYLYMNEQGDGVSTLPLFLSMRATIRAHVYAHQANLQANDKRHQLIEKAKAYLRMAVEFLDATRPQLVAIGGLSGTGKSTTSRVIAPELGSPIGARLLRTDILRKRIFGVSPETHLSPEDYSPAQSENVYATLFEEVETALKSGLTVIVDGVLASQSERQKIEAIAKRCNVPFTGIWLEAPLEKLQSRVDDRVGDASDADSSVVERQFGYDIGDLGNWQIVDSSGGADQVAGAVRSLLSKTIC